MKTEPNTNVAAPGLRNDELSDETLVEILTTMLHLKPDHRIHLVAEMITVISSRMLPELRDELVGTLLDSVEAGADIYDAEMAKRVLQ